MFRALRPRLVPLPVVPIRQVSDERWNRLAGSQKAALDQLDAALLAALDRLRAGQYRDPEAELLNCLDFARQGWQAKLDDEGLGERKKRRSFFTLDPHRGDWLHASHAGGALRLCVVSPPTSGWRCRVHRRETLTRSEDGHYFLVRETHPHRLLPPPHAAWLDGRVRVKALTTRAALLLALRACEPCLRADLLALLPTPGSRHEMCQHEPEDLALLAAAKPEEEELPEEEHEDEEEGDEGQGEAQDGKEAQ